MCGYDKQAALAQPDRVPGYEPVGRGFESLMPRHKRTLKCLPDILVFFLHYTAFLGAFKWFLGVPPTQKARFSIEIYCFCKLSESFFWCTFCVSLLCKERQKESGREDSNLKKPVVKPFFEKCETGTINGKRKSGRFKSHPTIALVEISRIILKIAESSWNLQKDMI